MLLENFDKLDQSELCQLIIRFFKEQSKANSKEGKKPKNILKTLMNTINTDINFRSLARFEYEIDPNDITRGFKPFSIKNKEEIRL